MTSIRLYLLLLLSSRVQGEEESPGQGKGLKGCESPIFCQGEFLDFIQRNKPYRDSKTFVDMKIKTSQDEILDDFKGFREANPSPGKPLMIDFLRKHFDEPGSEFDDFEPEDWVEEPEFISNIKDGATKDFAMEMHKKWKILGRKINQDVKDHPEKYSMIYVPNPVVVPGGRFREFYYWDTYWIILGLLVSNMTSTAKGMLQNFCHIVDTYGFVPNGGRIYYASRSQPPLLIASVYEYFKATGDKESLTSMYDCLTKEFDFWKGRLISVKIKDKERKVGIYRDYLDTPRPESYTEDAHIVEQVPEDERKTLFRDIRSAAESGWDFSSRWMIDEDGERDKGTLADTKTTSISPVDLNAILCGSAWKMRDMGKELGKEDEATKHQEFFDEMLSNLEEVFWNQSTGAWLDYNLKHEKPRNYFYASNFCPLWTMCYKPETIDHKLLAIFSYLKKNKISKYGGGFPTSLRQTGEQWDLPNSWPPLVHYIVVGFNNTKNPLAMHFAYELASQYLRANYRSFHKDHVMHEKYDSSKFGWRGGGGEYDPQEGFGWSNGAVLDLIYKYGDLISKSNILRYSKVLKLFMFSLFIYIN